MGDNKELKANKRPPAIFVNVAIRLLLPLAFQFLRIGDDIVAFWKQIGLKTPRLYQRPNAASANRAKSAGEPALPTTGAPSRQTLRRGNRLPENAPFRQGFDLHWRRRLHTSSSAASGGLRLRCVSTWLSPVPQETAFRLRVTPDWRDEQKTADNVDLFPREDVFFDPSAWIFAICRRVNS